MSILHDLVESFQHHRVCRMKGRVRIDRSTRLLRRFRVSFLAPPEDRLYLSVGKRCMLNGGITFESPQGQVDIGDRVYIGAHTAIISRERVSIGNDVTMAWGITIYDHNSHSLDWRQRQRVVEHLYRTYGTPRCFAGIDWTGVSSAPIVVADRVWIGFDAVILKGVTIGEGAIIGARSVVTNDVAPWTVVAGDPAVPIRRLPPPTE